MLVCGRFLFAGLLVITWLIGTASSDEPSLLGDLIYPKSSDAPILVDDKPIGTAADIETSARVREVNGDWLCIWVDRQKTEGWIKRSDVCLAREAIDYFTAQIAAAPNDDKAYLSRAAARKELGDLDNAFEDANQALRLKPTALAYISRGRIWSAKKEDDAAIKDFDEALRLDPKCERAYVGRAHAFNAKRDAEKASQDYDEAIRLEPKDPQAYAGRGHLHVNNRHFSQAIVDFDEAIRLDPNYAKAYSYRGWARFYKGDINIAGRDFEQALRLNPKDSWAYAGRGMIWTRNNAPDKALADFDKAIQLHCKMSRVYSARAKIWFEKGDLTKALSDANEAVHLDPDDARAYEARAATKAQAGDLDQALFDVDEAIRLNPVFGDAFGLRGATWAKKRDLKKAQSDLDEAIRLSPEEAGHFMNRGATWAIKGEFDKALLDFTEAIRLDPQMTKAYEARGQIWQMRREFDKALADFSELIRLDPKRTEMYAKRGRIWQNMREFEKAIADFDEVIRLNPKYADAYARRGTSRLRLQHFDQAIVDLSEAVHLNPTDSVSYFNRAQSLEAKKMYDDALADFDQGIRLDPREAFGFLGRASVWAELKQYDSAMTDVNEAIRLDPKNDEAFRFRGVVWEVKCELDKAINDFSQAINLNPTRGQNFEHRAVARSSQGDFHQAITDFNEAIRLDPTKESAYVGRGIAWRQLRVFDTAIRDFDEALRLKPKDAEVFFQRGEAWFAKRDFERAIADYNESIRLKPDQAKAHFSRSLAWLFKKNYAQVIADLSDAIRLEIEANSSDFLLARSQVTASTLAATKDGKRVVAIVNGQPIIEAEILHRYPNLLTTDQKSLATDAYRQKCEYLIQRHLREHVQRKLQSEAMLAKLKMMPLERQRSFEAYAKKGFEEHLEDRIEVWRVTTKSELDKKLRRFGSSIPMLEYQFRTELLARYHIESGVLERQISREEVFANYEQHLKQYELWPQVRWQQILISRRNEEEAATKLKALREGLKADRDFGELAVELSDGATAKKQGLFDWTFQGSLADEALDAALFKLPVDEPSEVMTSPNSYQVILVLERETGLRHTPFAEVAKEIREKLTKADQIARTTALIDQLWKTASIQSEYDTTTDHTNEPSQPPNNAVAETSPLMNPKKDRTLSVSQTTYQKVGDQENSSESKLPPSPEVDLPSVSKDSSSDEFDAMIAKASKVIENDPTDAGAYYHRGQTQSYKGDFAKAVADFGEAIRIDPKFTWAYRRRAWILATCPDSDVRNGESAIRDATTACELNAWQNDESLMILAAALAEAGRIEEAQQRLEEAIEMLPKNKTQTKAKMRECFQNGQPYRD